MSNFLDFATPLTRLLLVTLAVLVLPAVAVAQSHGPAGTNDLGFSVLGNPGDGK
jgi:hypothetical protein